MKVSRVSEYAVVMPKHYHVLAQLLTPLLTYLLAHDMKGKLAALLKSSVAVEKDRERAAALEREKAQLQARSPLVVTWLSPLAGEGPAAGTFALSSYLVISHSGRRPSWRRVP